MDKSEVDLNPRRSAGSSGRPSSEHVRDQGSSVDHTRLGTDEHDDSDKESPVDRAEKGRAPSARRDPAAIGVCFRDNELYHSCCRKT